MCHGGPSNRPVNEQSWWLLATMLALLATAALLVSCGDDNGDGTTIDSTPTTVAASPANGDGDELVELDLVAENTQFDKDRLQAPAGSEVSLTYENGDGVEHNFSLYPSEDSGDPLFEGPLLPGPSFVIYQFTAPKDPGTYYFQCDVHPDAMNGEFIAE